jgi:lysophospholipase L1-like esterase
LAVQQRGASNAVVGCLCDSAVAGQGAASHELGSNAKSLSWPTKLAKLIPDGSWSSVWGDNNISAAACDVILMSGAPSKTGVFASHATQAAYVTNMRSLAYAADVPFIDIWALFGATWKSSAMADPLHPNGVGYELIAGYARTAVLNPAARSLG